MQNAVLSRNAKSAIGISIVAFFLDGLLQLVIIPLIPVYKAMFALNSLEISIVLSAGQFVVLIFGMSLGRAIDKLKGIQRALGVSSVLLLAVVALLYAFSENWIELVIASAVQGLSMALMAPSLNALLVKLVSNDFRTTLLVRVDSLVNISSLLAPVITAGLFSIVGTKYALIIVFIVCLCEAFALFIIYAKLPKEVECPETNPLLVGAIPKIAIILGAGLFSLAVAVFELIIPLVLSINLRFTPSDIAIFLFIIGIGFAFPQWWVPNLVKRYGAKKVLVFGGLGLIVGNSILSASHDWYFAIIIVLTSPFAGIVLATVTNLAGNTEAVGESFGLMQASISAGYIVGSLGSGFLFKNWGSTAALLFASVVTLIVVICLLLIRMTSSVTANA